MSSALVLCSRGLLDVAGAVVGEVELRGVYLAVLGVELAVHLAQSGEESLEGVAVEGETSHAVVARRDHIRRPQILALQRLLPEVIPRLKSPPEFRGSSNGT